MAQAIPEGAKSNKTLLIDPKSVIVQDGWNPREDFGDIDALALSIIANGVLNPITVQVREGKAYLVDGGRRLAATLRAIEGFLAPTPDGKTEFKQANIEFIPAMSAPQGANQVQLLAQALVRNEGKPLSELEEAKAYERFITWGLEPKDIAERLGKPISTVRNRLTLLQASPAVQAAVKSGEASVNTAIAIVKAAGGDIGKQNGALKAAAQAKADGEDINTVRQRIQEAAGKLDANKKRHGSVDAGPASAEQKAPVVTWHCPVERKEDDGSRTERDFLVRARSVNEALEVVKKVLHSGTWVIDTAHKVEFGSEGWMEI